MKCNIIMTELTSREKWDSKLHCRSFEFFYKILIFANTSFPFFFKRLFIVIYHIHISQSQGRNSTCRWAHVIRIGDVEHDLDFFNRIMGKFLKGHVYCFMTLVEDGYFKSELIILVGCVIRKCARTIGVE